jgi:hypothetical protein
VLDVLFQNRIFLYLGEPTGPGIRLGGASFQMIKQPFRESTEFGQSHLLCAAQIH